jgi:ribosome-associated protein
MPAETPRDEVTYRFSRSSGPGGQNVNKVNTKVAMYWDLEASILVPDSVKMRFRARYGHRLTLDGMLVITSDQFRDQKRNQEDCLDKLTELLDSVWEAPKPRKKTKPTRGSKEKRLQGKREAKEKKKMRQRPEY